jgi:hypothetical protein
VTPPGGGARRLAAVLFEDEHVTKIDGRAVPIETLKDLHARDSIENPTSI